jgi:hypothetical protein
MKFVKVTKITTSGDITCFINLSNVQSVEFDDKLNHSTIIFIKPNADRMLVRETPNNIIGTCM